MENLGLVTLIMIFLALCFFHPTYFMADDWERLYAHYSENTDNFLRAYYLRYFVQGFSSEYIFRLFFFFPSVPLFLGKFVLWGCLLMAAWLYIDSFNLHFANRSLRHSVRTSPWWGMVPLIAAFHPNNYEWNFFPTIMTLLPTLLIMAIIFRVTHRGPITLGKILFNTLAILLGFYAYESLLPFAILMEIAFFFYSDKKSQSDGKTCKSILSFSFPVILSAVVLKIISYQHHMAVNGHLQTESYSAKLGFKAHLFWQMISMTINHDYYKTRWGTGILALIGVILFIWARMRTSNRKTILKRDLPLILSYLIGTSYYYLIMDYSARRAMGGPLYFFWGFFFLCFLYLFQHPSLSKTFRKVLCFFIIVPFFLHHGYIFKEKKFEKDTFFKAAKEIKEKIHRSSESEIPVVITIEEVTHDLKRGWHLVNPIQLHGLLSHHLSKVEYGKVLPFKKQFPTFHFIYDIK